MRVKWVALIGMLIVALPVLAGADIIPISDVNENGEPVNPEDPAPPALQDSVVTVQGVAMVATGVLGDSTNIYIQAA